MSRNTDLNNDAYEKASLDMKISLLIEQLKDSFYENMFQIDTSPCSIRNKRVINFSYEPTPYSFLEFLFTKYPFENQDHFVDFGCGKGRALVMASKYLCPFITGYEINPDIFTILNKNIEVHKSLYPTTSKFLIYNQDVTKVNLEDTTNKFYFANPFYLKVFIHVINSILNSIKRSSRKIFLFLYMPHRTTLEYLRRINVFQVIESVDICETIPLYAILSNID